MTPEERLREALERMREFAEHSPNCVFAADLSGVNGDELSISPRRCSCGFDDALILYAAALAAAQADTYPTPHDRLSAFIEGTFLEPEERDKLRAALEALSADTAQADTARPYYCGGAQNGQPRPHDRCNCTPRAAQADTAPGGEHIGTSGEHIGTSGELVVNACIALVKQSLDTVRGERVWTDRVKASIDAREHVIRLLTSYRAALAAPSRDAGLDGDDEYLLASPADGAPFPAGVNRADSEGER